MAIAAADTAYGKWSGGLHNHCGPVSYLVQKKFGGHIVSGKIKGESHLWNRLLDGKEIDLTSDQYGGNGISPIKRGRIMPSRHSVNKRFLKFEERVKNWNKKIS